MKKILLIQPPQTMKEIYGKLGVIAPSQTPIGILSIGAVLKKQGHRVEIIDCQAEGLDHEELFLRIVTSKPDIIGVTSTTVSFNSAKHLLARVKEEFPRVTTLFGGSHLSAIPEKTMRECPHIDIGVLGEGEKTVSEIVRMMDECNEVRGIKGIIVREGGTIHKSAPQEPIRDLDSLPFPAWDLLKSFQDYHLLSLRGEDKGTIVVTSRGCPFNCSYCSQAVFGHNWRFNSVDYVIEQVKYLVRRYGLNFIDFEEDLFTVLPKRVEAICERILSDDLAVRWSCMAKAGHVSLPLLRLMKKAGCSIIYMGIESSSDRVLSLLNKGVTRHKIEESVRMVHEAGINVYGSFIFGVPTQTIPEMRETLSFARSLPIHSASFFLFTPYPGTRLRDIAFLHGKVSTNWDDYSAHPTRPAYIEKGFSDKFLSRWIIWAYVVFLLKPKNFRTHFPRVVRAMAQRVARALQGLSEGAAKKRKEGI